MSDPDSRRHLTTDDLDGELVRALQSDGRVSIHELSRRLSASRDVVSGRLRRLLAEDGLKVVAAVDPGFAGHQVLVHMMIDVDGPARPVARQLTDFDSTVLVSLVSGSWPLVVESRHADSSDMDEMLTELRRIPAVRTVRTTRYAEVFKGFFVSHSRKEIVPDRIDIDLITLLQADGRMSFTKLAEAVHLSPSSVRERVTKLLNAGVIRISAIRPGGISRNRFSTGLGISARGDLGVIRERIAETPAIDFSARTHGSFDFIATVHGHVSDEVLEAIEDLRALPEVTSIDSWTHLDLVKEEYARSVGQVVRQRSSSEPIAKFVPHD